MVDPITTEHSLTAEGFTPLRGKERMADPTSPAQPADRMLQFFEYAHLPERLQKISKPFGELAENICMTLPPNPERTVALRKLLEAKDCAVRAQLFR